MNHYPISKTPSPAISFGAEGYVDPQTFGMMQNHCNTLQNQNFALQQENLAMHQQRENQFSKAADKAYLTEFTAYDAETFVTSPDGKVYVVMQNQMGEMYKIKKLLSECLNFTVRYSIDPRDGSTSIEVQFSLPNGALTGFTLAMGDFQLKKLFYKFSESGGTLCCGKDGPRLLYELVSQLLSNQETHIISLAGWNLTEEKNWFFKGLPEVSVMLDKAVVPSLQSESHLMLSLLTGISFLKTRLPEAMQLTKPPSLICEQQHTPTAACMSCKPTEFIRILTSNRDKLLVYIRDGSADCQPTGTGTYRMNENYRLLQEEVQKGTLARTLYVILSTKITPALREKSLPVQVEESVSSVQDEALPVTWNDVISIVENNPTEFDARVQYAYQKEYALLEDSNVQQDAAVLNAVIEVICWTISRTAPKWETQARKAYESLLEHYTCWWDSLSNDAVPEVFRDALYAAAHRGFLRFREVKDADETFNKEKEVLYDDTYFYISTAMLKKLIASFMPQYLASDVLAKLSEADVLSGSMVKTLTLSPNYARNFRFRTIARSFVKKPGCRDIVHIKGDDVYANAVKITRRTV